MPDTTPQTRFRACCFVASLTVILSTGLYANEQLKEFCPVLSNERATDDYVIEHEGRSVYLCCKSCITRFKKVPRAFCRISSPRRP